MSLKHAICPAGNCAKLLVMVTGMVMHSPRGIGGVVPEDGEKLAADRY